MEKITNEKKEHILVTECFCTRNNGGMTDILAQYSGKDITEKTKDSLAIDLAQELIAYNEGKHSSVFIDGFSVSWANKLADDEVELRSNGQKEFPSQWDIDNSRFEEIMNWE